MPLQGSVILNLVVSRTVVQQQLGKFSEATEKAPVKSIKEIGYYMYLKERRRPTGAGILLAPVENAIAIAAKAPSIGTHR